MNDISWQDRLGRGRSGRIHSAGRVHGIPSLQSFGDSRATCRQIHQIEYTPAPDIVHEAAGHAPIIVDGEYSNYLQRFRAKSAQERCSRKGFRALSSDPALVDLEGATEQRSKRNRGGNQAGRASGKNFGRTVRDGAGLSRLHWWTVEYGLIGTLESPKIYGAGLLSSIGESVSCLEANVKKIPYSIDAMNQPFDINDEAAAAFCLPRFQTSPGCARGICEPKWLIKSVGSKASTKRSSATTPRPANTRPVFKSPAFSRGRYRR